VGDFFGKGAPDDFWKGSKGRRIDKALLWPEEAVNEILAGTVVTSRAGTTPEAGTRKGVSLQNAYL